MSREQLFGIEDPTTSITLVNVMYSIQVLVYVSLLAQSLNHIQAKCYLLEAMECSKTQDHDKNCEDEGF